MKPLRMDAGMKGKQFNGSVVILLIAITALLFWISKGSEEFSFSFFLSIFLISVNGVYLIKALKNS